MKIANLLRDATEFPDNYIVEVAQHRSLLKGIDGARAWTSRLLRILRGSSGQLHRDVEAHLFELKVMCWIARNRAESDMRYEPEGIDPQGKRVDLLVGGKQSWLLELKTFRPDDYSGTIPLDHVPRRNILLMSGDEYHRFQAVRGHLIDEVLDFESKASNYARGPRLAFGVLCDFYLPLEKYRDFVAFYMTGRGAPHDALGIMAAHKMTSQHAFFSRTISAFWAFRFPKLSFEAEWVKCVTPTEDLELVV